MLKNVSVAMVFGSMLVAGCAIDAADAQPAGDDGSDEAAALQAPAADQVLDARKAAASDAVMRGMITPKGLDSSWYSGTVAAGATQHWTWNNASATAAYKVGLSPTGASTSAVCQFTVSRAWDVEQNTGEREFHFDIKNTGSIACGTTVLLGSQARSATWATGGINAGASKSWTWNNANPLTVSHLVSITPSGATSTATCQLEVTRSWYVQQPTGEREFHFTVLNAGTIACQGDVDLATATAADSSWSTPTLAPGASHSTAWNNANPLDRIYVPGLSPLGASGTSSCQLEIPTTSYQQQINADGSSERRFILTETNPGALTCAGTVLLNHL